MNKTEYTFEKEAHIECLQINYKHHLKQKYYDFNYEE